MSNILHLNSLHLLEQVWQLTLLVLQVRVSSNVVSANEDVGNSSLTRDFLQSILDSRSIIDLVQLNGVELGAQRRQKLLGGFAVRAVRLGEHSHGMLGDD